MSTGVKMRVKVRGVNISCVTWASTLRCSAFKARLPACLLFDWVFWTIKSCRHSWWWGARRPYRFKSGECPSARGSSSLGHRWDPLKLARDVFLFRHSSYQFNGRHLIPAQPCYVTGESSFLKLNFCSLDDSLHDGFCPWMHWHFMLLIRGFRGAEGTCRFNIVWQNLFWGKKTMSHGTNLELQSYF